MEPSIGVFFHFYGTKGVEKLSWVSINAHPYKKLFPTYSSNFKKDWRETFVRVQGENGCVETSVKVDGVLRFPLCWTSVPVYVVGFDFDKMMPYEHGVVGFLERMLLMDIHELLNRESDPESIEMYLHEYLPLFLLFISFSVCLLIASLLLFW